MSVASNSRLAYWNNWKGIAIIAVVMIHATTQAFQFSIESFNFSFAMVLRQFINYAVPVFLALAGYFAFTPKRKEKIGFYYKSRAKRILLPYAIWTAIYLILKTPTVAPDFNEIIEGYLFGTGIGIGYFVIVLIQFVLITPFFLKIDSLKIHFSIMLVLTFFGLAFTYYFKAFNTSSFFSSFPGGGLPLFVWYPFYHLGFVIAKYKCLVKVLKIRTSLLIIGIALALGFAVFEGFYWVYQEKISLGSSQIKLTSFIVSTLIFLLAVRLSTKKTFCNSTHF